MKKNVYAFLKNNNNKNTHKSNFIEFDTWKKRRDKGGFIFFFLFWHQKMLIFLFEKRAKKE